MFDGPYGRMVALLDRERDFLRRGDVRGAADLADAKERLIAALLARQPSADEVETLRRKADRNQALVDAAARGIAAARDRLDAIRRGRDIHAYAANGTREVIRPPENRLQKRA